MEIFWFITIVLVLGIFFLLDGYDFGAGIIHLFFAKEEKDKVLIAKSAGLFWDFNEVWLVAGGGLLFMAFPTYYASVFSGFYLPLIIVLWLTVFRALGLEFRSQFDSQAWKDFWDKAFGVSSLLLALFFGIGLGNIVRGVNLGGAENGVSLYEKHYFFLPLWDSSFSPLTDHPGVIDWFTLIVGIIAVITLAIHGANWIILKTNSSINKQLKSIIFNLNIALAVMTVVSIFVLMQVSPQTIDNFSDTPWFVIFPLLYLVGLAGLFLVKHLKNNLFGFLFSCLLILGGITTSLAAIFPQVLPSTNGLNESLTIYNTSASHYGLSIALAWGVVGFILLAVYIIVQRKLLSGKIDRMDYGH
jgi:cytochrome bd ubiquinol oxidase subunit II